MTDRTVILTTDDKRRAAAFLRHANPAEPNIGGMNAVLHEAYELGRGTPLTLAVAGIAYAVSGLGTDVGQSGLERYALAMYNESTKENS